MGCFHFRKDWMRMVKEEVSLYYTTLGVPPRYVVLYVPCASRDKQWRQGEETEQRCPRKGETLAIKHLICDLFFPRRPNWKGAWGCLEPW